MELTAWLPAISTTGLFALVLWLTRQIISTRLARSVQHEFDKKIESIRAQFRESEERFKADLRAREAEITALRSGTLSILASRHAALDKRRLEAIEQIWKAFIALAPARFIVVSMGMVKLESAAQQAEKDPKVRRYFELMDTGFDLKSPEFNEAARARPFVSPMVWAIYSAIQAITMHSVICLHILKGGLGTLDLVDRKGVEKLVIAVLPHFDKYLETNGPSVYGNVLEELDRRLLEEIQNMLSGSESDSASLLQAAEIIRQSNALDASTKASAIQAR